MPGVWLRPGIFACREQFRPAACVTLYLLLRCSAALLDSERHVDVDADRDLAALNRGIACLEGTLLSKNFPQPDGRRRHATRLRDVDAAVQLDVAELRQRIGFGGALNGQLPA